MSGLSRTGEKIGEKPNRAPGVTSSRFTMERDVEQIPKAGVALSVTYLDLAFGDILGLAHC